MEPTSTTSVLAHAVLLLRECYGAMGAEPDTETDSMGELINPASVELFEALDDFLKEVTGLQEDDDTFRQWIFIHAHNRSVLADTLESSNLDQIDQNLKNKEYYY